MILLHFNRKVDEIVIWVATVCVVFLSIRSMGAKLSVVLFRGDLERTLSFSKTYEDELRLGLF